MRIFYAILTAMLVLSSTPTIRAQSSGVELLDAIQAIIHDSIVTRQDVVLDVMFVRDALLREYRDQGKFDQAEFEKKMARAWDDDLEGLIESQLILHDFKTAGYKLPESIIDEMVQERIRARYAGDRTRAIKSLQEEGSTLEKLRERVRDDFIIQQMTFKNISSELILSPHKIETYYVEHKDLYKTEDEVKLRVILLNKSSDADPAQTRKRAEEILSKIKEGASFAEMASVNSESSERSRGGERDWEKISVLLKELADIAATLKPGETSGVIETPEACYLIRVEDKRAAHIRPLNGPDGARDDIEKKLLAEEHNRLRKQWIDRLRKKTFVRYF